MTPARSTSRRRFLCDAASLGVAAAAPTVVHSTARAAEGRASPSNRIAVGMIGLGRQTYHANLKPFLRSPDTQVVALCDVDSWRLAQAKEIVEQHYAEASASGTHKGCATYRDFRELLARDDIDAVMISTPDHWHVPMAVAAVKAGKHVSCEKPLTRSIGEGRVLADAVAKHQRVFRTDSEFRSIPHMHRAVELVRNGRLGKLTAIRTGVPQGDVALPQQPEMPVPKELDYELWLGPAPVKPYTEKRVHSPQNYGRPGWMRNRDYCDGMVTNWGTHLNDIAQWGNGTERTGPVEVEATGEFPPEDGLWNVLLKFDVHYRFANGVRMHYTSGKPYVRFEGDEGWIQADYPKGLTAEPASVLEAKLGDDEIRFPLKSDKEDFIDAIKSRGQTLEDAEVGHRTTSLCHLGLIAVQVGKKLQWDPVAERFANSDEANELLTVEYREPWGG